MVKLKIPEKDFYKQHLSKFSQYSQSNSWINWYAKTAKYKGLRTVKILKTYKKSNARLLDLGCGIGLTLSMLSQEFPQSIGCDVDKKALGAARIILKKVGVKIPLIIYDGKTLPFDDHVFDIVTAIEVIEHVNHPRLFLKEIKRVLKPDGILHITTGNKWWPYEPHFKLPFLSYLPPQIANLYVKLSGRGKSYQGIKLPSYGEFRKLVGNFFSIEDITLSVIENYREFSLGKERGVKVIVLGEFLKLLRKMDALPILKFLPLMTEWFLLRISLGWLFIGRPKRKIK